MEKNEIKTGGPPFKLDSNFKLEEKLLDLKEQLMEKSEELKKRDQIITALERDIDNRDTTIRFLKNELEKYKLVVQPLTQRLVVKKRGNSNDDDDPLMMSLPGLERTRVTAVAEPRLKRTAISAEPLSVFSQSGHDLEIIKIKKPKT